jgi:hypothetical protein
LTTTPSTGTPIDVKRLSDANESARAEVLALLEAGDSDGAKKRLVEKETPAWRELRALLVKQIEESDEEKGRFEQQLAARIREAKIVAGAVALFAVFVCAALCWRLSLSITTATTASRSSPVTWTWRSLARCGSSPEPRPGSPLRKDVHLWRAASRRPARLSRSRNASHPAPPPQIRACGATAHGSCLGW